MNWTNWTTYANSVLTWFLGLFPTILGSLMDNPVIGVPIILVIIAMVVNLVLRFVGGLGGNKSEK